MNMRSRVIFAGALALVGVIAALVGYHEGKALYGLAGAAVAALAVALSLIGTSVKSVDQVEPSVETEDVSQVEQVRQDPITDPVTGLMNELFFSGLLGTKVATARRRLWPLSVVLIFVSLDDDVEDEDKEIFEFSNVVRSTIRTADVACRVGARSFALLLDDTDEDGAAWVAERIQIAQARRGSTGIKRVCAGISAYPSNGIEAQELLVNAKEALKKALESNEDNGLGRVVVAPQRPI
jgi:diguanylate cyclase (GGDEF)-like protein